MTEIEQQLAGLRHAMHAIADDHSTPEERQAQRTARLMQAHRIMGARPGLLLHHVIAVLEAQEVVQFVDAAATPPAPAFQALRDQIAEAIWGQYSNADPSRDGLVMANPHSVADVALAVLRRTPQPEIKAAILPAPADQAERNGRYREAIRNAVAPRGPWGPEHDAAARAAMDLADQEQAELRRERDLAITHDRQPHPTAWAYEQACAALRRKTDAIERVLAFADSLDDIARKTAGPEAVHPVAAHIRHQLDTTADVAQQAEPVGENPTEADVDRMLAEGVPVQIVTGAPSTFTTQPPAADADQAANARLASGLRALMAHDAAEEQPT